MGYIIGVDGGATKTRMILGDHYGNIIGDITGKGCGHWIIGFTGVKDLLMKLTIKLLNITGVSGDDIDFIYLGLTGADTEGDIKALETVCRDIYGKKPFKVVNDAWIVLRSGTIEDYGVVSICGTGTNSAGTNEDGEKRILRALGYELGSFGGGKDLAKDALHYACRGDELTYKPTVLQKLIPEYFEVESIEEVIKLFYPKRTVDTEKFHHLAKLVFTGANMNDEVCQEIIINNATTVAYQATGIIKQLKMEKEQFPLVIGGSIFKNPNPLFTDCFTTIIHKTAPHAYIVNPALPPVYGAYLGGMDCLNIKQTEYIDANLLENIE